MPCKTESGYISLCSTHPGDWEQVAEAARNSDGKVIPSFGIHPWYLDGTLKTLPRTMASYLDEFPHAGVGEVGLDKTRHASEPLDDQKEVLRWQIGLCKRYNRVLTLHCVRAWGSLLEILNETRPEKIILHGWNGPSELVKDFASLGACFSIGKKALESQDACSWVGTIPENLLLIETDEGEESLSATLSMLSSLRRDETVEQTAQYLHGNFTRLFLS